MLASEGEGWQISLLVIKGYTPKSTTCRPKNALYCSRSHICDFDKARQEPGICQRRESYRIDGRKPGNSPSRTRYRFVFDTGRPKVDRPKVGTKLTSIPITGASLHRIETSLWHSWSRIRGKGQRISIKCSDVKQIPASSCRNMPEFNRIPIPIISGT